MSEETTKYPESVSADNLAFLLVTEAEKPNPNADKVLDLFRQIVILLANEKDEKRLEPREGSYAFAVQKFVDHGMVPALSKIFQIHATYTGDKLNFGRECAAILKEAAARNRLTQAKIDCCEFGSVRPTESLKRLDFLLTLQPGLVVVDKKNHICGEVAKEDAFEKRVYIRFDDNPDALRPKGFAFAAESLEPISETSILYKRHKDPAGFEQLCAEKAGDVVEDTLRVFGEMTVEKLQETLTAGILPASVEWKNFWSQAKKQLAEKESVYIPAATRKSENLSFISRSKQEEPTAVNEGMIRKLATERDSYKLLDEIEHLLVGAGADVLTEEQRAILTDRIAYLLRASVADRKLGNPGKVRAIMLALRMGLDKVTLRLGDTAEDEFAFEGTFVPAENNTILLRDTLCMSSVILDAAAKLPAKMMGEIMDALPIDTDLAVAKKFIDMIQAKDVERTNFSDSVREQMNAALLDRVAPKLLLGAGAADFEAFLRKEFSKQFPSFPLLHWICRFYTDKKLQDALAKIFTPFAIVSQAFASLERDAAGDDLKMRNSIEKLILSGTQSKKDAKLVTKSEDGTKWLLPLAKQMSAAERATIFVRLRPLEKYIGKYPSTRLVNTLKDAYPELEEYQEKPAPEVVRGFYAENVTSPRSYQERKAAYDHLMNEEMPKNRKDIEHAKSFGDLSENFEYESARNAERALVARQTQYENDLKNVKAFNFATDVPEQNGHVGMGSYVTVINSHGEKASYAILGVWDSDTTLNIISCETPLAKVLLDHVVNDEIVLDVDVGDEQTSYKIISIEPLPPEVVAWTSA
ncbi:MAG: GreA/GreB family elongation factor [Kiritimatiellia bacterium]